MSENGSQLEKVPDTNSRQPKPYVVLEESSIVDAVSALLTAADVGLSNEEWDRIEKAAKSEGPVYKKVATLKSRNSQHALKQVGGRSQDEGTKPLVAVSERMFRPRKVNVSFDPRVSVS